MISKWNNVGLSYRSSREERPLPIVFMQIFDNCPCNVLLDECLWPKLTSETAAYLFTDMSNNIHMMDLSITVILWVPLLDSLPCKSFPGFLNENAGFH